ncbi:hypothetical protein ACFX2J_004850 [Malus domestica]
MNYITDYISVLIVKLDYGINCYDDDDDDDDDDDQGHLEDGNDSPHIAFSTTYRIMQIYRDGANGIL